MPQVSTRPRRERAVPRAAPSPPPKSLPNGFCGSSAPGLLGNKIEPLKVSTPLKTTHNTHKHPQKQTKLYTVLPSRQFQALLHSRFQVLCIFPSRYLSAIGLSPLFSFGRRVPPALRCTPKQRDSPNARRTRAFDRQATHGILTLSDAPFQGTWACPPL